MTRLTATTPRQNVPGPPGIPLLGSALELRRDQLATLEDAHHRYGDVVRFSAGPPGLRIVMYAVFSPEGARQVLTGTGRRYTKGSLFYRETAAMLGDGILTSEGDRWQRQKRFIQPLFTRRRVAGYVDVMAEETTALIHRWDTAARPSGTVDAAEDVMHLTLAVIGRVLFGADLDQATPALRDAFPVVNAHVLRRAQSPLRFPATWPTRANRRAARAQRQLYEVVEGIIDRRRAASSAGEDLLSLLLRARDPDALGADALDDAEIRDQVLIFLLAGHETTATTLTFALHLLGHHPDVQQRVRVEAERVLGTDDQRPTAERIAALGYTTQVVKEAMRLYPSAYAMGRQIPEGDVIDGYHIPPGADVIVSPWVTHRHPRVWEQPQRFDPDRFTPEQEKQRHRYAYLPFGGGPRACIGQYFSMLEATLATASIVRAFGLHTPPGPVPLTTGIVLRPAGYVPLTLAPRPPHRRLH
ncbi:MAG TPA: cytochrome P450 [Pseudonocardiaceae bacterium]|nr:cytochrome P450 [Pseudonocardiaceae bacterium]